jgi:hypothetical protein
MANGIRPILLDLANTYNIKRIEMAGTPVDFDPFANQPKAVDFDPFAAKKPAYMQILGGENVVVQPYTSPSMQDRIMGLVETPAIMAGDVGRMITTPVARMFGEAYGGYGTPQGDGAKSRPSNQPTVLPTAHRNRP